MVWKVFALTTHNWKQWYNANERTAIVTELISRVQTAYPSYYNQWVSDGEIYSVWNLKQDDPIPVWFMPGPHWLRTEVALDDEPTVHIRIITAYDDEEEHDWVCAGILSNTPMDTELETEFDEE